MNNITGCILAVVYASVAAASLDALSKIGCSSSLLSDNWVWLLMLVLSGFGAGTLVLWFILVDQDMIKDRK